MVLAPVTGLGWSHSSHINESLSTIYLILLGKVTTETVLTSWTGRRGEIKYEHVCQSSLSTVFHTLLIL